MLRLDGRGDAVRGLGEDGKEPVAGVLHHPAAVILHCPAYDGLVPTQSGGHRVGILLPCSGAALNVGEQERDVAGRKRHPSFREVAGVCTRVSHPLRRYGHRLEPLGQEHGQVLGHQPAQLLRCGEGLVADIVAGPDAIEEGFQARVAIGRWFPTPPCPAPPSRSSASRCRGRCDSAQGRPGRGRGEGGDGHQARTGSVTAAAKPPPPARRCAPPPAPPSWRRRRRADADLGSQSRRSTPLVPSRRRAVVADGLSTSSRYVSSASSPAEEVCAVRFTDVTDSHRPGRRRPSVRGCQDWRGRRRCAKLLLHGRLDP